MNDTPRDPIKELWESSLRDLSAGARQSLERGYDADGWWTLLVGNLGKALDNPDVRKKIAGLGVREKKEGPVTG
jgi:hypothetical protein